MKGRANYRVKVDLSNYHQDARRFSWIYIDCTNVWYISHVKQRISTIFEIPEPFHLLLNGKEYLSATEDVRVLKKNELILVVPGSGICTTNASTAAMPSAVAQHSIVKQTVPSVDRNEDSYRGLYNMPTDVEQDHCQVLDNSLKDISAIQTTVYHSMREESEIEPTPNSKTTDDNVTDNCSTIDRSSDTSRSKRKRTRRKKSKNVTADAPSSEIVDSHKNKGFQVPVLSTGRHIHFDNAYDNTDEKIASVVENGAKSNQNGSIVPNQPSLENCKTTAVSASLSTLLALRQCSTPLTFVSKKAKRANENELEESAKKLFKPESNNNSPKNGQASQDEQTNGNDGAVETTKESNEYSDIDPEKCPSVEATTELEDVIAFKILKIGNEYTPEVSDYIVARTINWCPEKSLYTFQILRGQAQIQTPLGKFSLPEDESESQICDTATFNFSQLIDPRLIYRKPKEL